MTAIRPLVAVALIALAANQIAAQDRPAATRSQLSIAAGYKAQFVCSGTFNAGKTIDAIRADELTGIYPEVEPLLTSVSEAEIDREQGFVLVEYAGDMPPRIASWQPGRGCVALPPGTDVEEASTAAGNIPGAFEQVPLRSTAAREMQRWPIGNAGPVSDSKTLNRLARKALAGDFGGKTSAVLIAQDGELLHESYAPGFTPTTSQRTWSVAKSIAATIVGAAANTQIESGDGILAIFARTAGNEISAFHERYDPRQRISLDNFLRMASGLDTGGPGSRTDAIYFGAGAVTRHATKHTLIHEPGTAFNYANNDTLLAMLALQESMDSAGLDYHRFVRETLDRIGMRDTVPETDWQGNFILSSQVWSTARDLARLGQLYLDDGIVQGERILREGWVSYATTPSGPQPPQRGGPGGCRLGYGAQFWLYNDCDGIPDGSFAALGNRGQFVVIVPARKAVIVRRGYDTASNRFDMVAFARDVLDELGR